MNQDDWYDKNIKNVLLTRLSSFQLGPSNATLQEIISMSIHIHQYQIINVGTWFETPKIIRDKNAIFIN